MNPKSAHQSARTDGLAAAAAAPAGKITVACHLCGKEVQAKLAKDGKNAKTPKGRRKPDGTGGSWRKIDCKLTCADCVRGNYYIRAIRVQIKGPAENESRPVEEMRANLGAAAKQTCDLANWYLQRLYAADEAVRLAVAEWPLCQRGKRKGEPQMPSAPSIGTECYRAAVKRFPALSGRSISGVLKMIDGWYVSDRFKMFVAQNQSVRNYRWGALPIEVRAADWKLGRDSAGKLTIRLPVQPGKSWTLSVYADAINRTRLEKIESGDAIGLGLKIIRATKRQPAGSNEPPRKAWFLKISALLPKSKIVRQSHQAITLTLGHDAEALWFGAIDGSEETVEFPAVELRKRIKDANRLAMKMRKEKQALRTVAREAKRSDPAYAKFLERKAAQFNEQQARLDKKNRWLDTWFKTACAWLTGRCVALGVTSVDYDITDRGFLPNFPWRKLRDQLHTSLENVGIALHILGSDGNIDDEANSRF